MGFAPRVGQRQRGGLLMAVLGVAVVIALLVAWASSGRVGYLLSGIGFALLVPSYLPASLRAAGGGTAAAAHPRWIGLAAFAGAVLVLIGLIVTFLA